MENFLWLDRDESCPSDELKGVTTKQTQEAHSG